MPSLILVSTLSGEDHGIPFGVISGFAVEGILRKDETIHAHRSRERESWLRFIGAQQERANNLVRDGLQFWLDSGGIVVEASDVQAQSKDKTVDVDLARVAGLILVAKPEC